MVDELNNAETAENKASAEALDRARLSREKREAEQRKRLDELRAHAKAAQAQREKRDEDRRRRQAEQRAKDDERRLLVEERKKAIWEASISRREALLQRERDRTERLEKARASRSSPRSAFAFGSSTPRLLEPVDSAGFFWAARRAASTTNVMFASAPLTRRASALQLDGDSDNNKDEPDRTPPPAMWSSVARRRTDLVPTIPASRAPGRAYSMTRLDRLPSAAPLRHSASPSMHLLHHKPRSGETTPGSRPGSAMSGAVVRRASSAPRRPRPASIAGTGVNTPRDAGSVATTPSVSRDSTVVAATPRRPRPLSLHVQTKSATPSPLAPGEGKPPLHRKPKLPKEHDKSSRPKSSSASPGRALSPAPSHEAVSKDSTVKKKPPSTVPEKVQIPVSAQEVTEKLEALQIQKDDEQITSTTTILEDKENENKETIVHKEETIEDEKEELEIPKVVEKKIEVLKPVEKRESLNVQEKTEDNEMTASMTARRITTEEEAKAALAERRRRAREEFERQAELERLRLQKEAEEEAERQRIEEERQRREEEEARELARLQREMEQEKLKKAIEAQQQLEREEAEKKVREEADRQTRLKEEEDKRRAMEEAEKTRREEADREEKERLARKQRVEAIMARTRLKKAEEEKKAAEKKQQEEAQNNSQPASQGAENSKPNVNSEAPRDNGNANKTDDLLGLNSVQPQPQQTPAEPPRPAEAAPPASNNGNTADLLGLSDPIHTEDKKEEQQAPLKPTQIDNAITNTPIMEQNNGNVHNTTPNQTLEPTVGHISANFIQTERMNAEHSQNKMADVPKLIDDDFTTHNGHNNHMTIQNAI